MQNRHKGEREKGERKTVGRQTRRLCLRHPAWQERISFLSLSSSFAMVTANAKSPSFLAARRETRARIASKAASFHSDGRVVAIPIEEKQRKIGTEGE